MNRCDYFGHRSHQCRFPSFAEVYWKDEKGMMHWSYLCLAHFVIVRRADRIGWCADTREIPALSFIWNWLCKISWLGDKKRGRKN